MDNWLIETLQGGARLMLHRPTPREVVLTHDEPWEGNGCAYFTIFRDGDIYRMYHRGDNYNVSSPDKNTWLQTHEEFTCYAESQDGVRWTKPHLGIVAFDGSKENNIILAGMNVPCPRISGRHCETQRLQGQSLTERAARSGSMSGELHAR